MATAPHTPVVGIFMDSRGKHFQSYIDKQNATRADMGVLYYPGASLGSVCLRARTYLDQQLDFVAGKVDLSCIGNAET